MRIEQTMGSRIVAVGNWQRELARETARAAIRLVGALCLSLQIGAIARAQESSTDQPLPPAEAARTAVVPAGFRVDLFAGEPDVQQPIGFCIDDRGRLWVAEAYNYPNHGTKPGDRIVIFEDADGDGRFDKRTVFFEGLNYVTGIEVGFGGAWVMSPPSFYFIPDRNGDDRPDSAPQVLLDGFGNHANAHNLANGFAWGPDGWLYGTHGRTNWSLLGKPGTPEKERVRFDGGVYRYHPTRHVWEPYADGTTNPWGIDWDDYGEAFVCNCVNPHLFHVIHGAHYEPWRNRESSRYAYERIPSIADHLHFVGVANVRDGLGSDAEDEAGGGHAHCGTMVYLGDNWPAEYRNSVFMNNIHGKRINNDLLRRSGSGYTAAHGRDLLRSRDPWFMGVTLAYGPDGGVYVSDWSDTGECHSVKNTRRHTGRIFKITYQGGDSDAPRKSRPMILGSTGSLADLSDDQLVERQLHRNDWHVRHARRVLQERAAAGRDMSEVRRRLFAMYENQTDVTRKLRALWSLQVIGALRDDPEFLIRQLDHANEYVQSWAVRLLCEGGVKSPPAPTTLARFRELARTTDSQLVRLHLASNLQRLPLAARWPIVEALANRGEDARDANLPLMLWYGAESLVEQDVERFVSLAFVSQIPLVRRHAARRLLELPRSERALGMIVSRLGGDAASASAEALDDLLAGMLEGLAGRRTVSLPAAWPAAYAKLSASSSESVRDQALRLALIFDDPTALRTLRAEAADKRLDERVRNRAIAALVAKKASDTGPLLASLVSDPVTRRAALRGLAEFNEPRTASVILGQYAAFDAAARQDALQTLAARPAWGGALLDALEAGQIDRQEVTSFTIRQLLSLRDPKLAARVTKLWGEVRSTPADKAKQIADHKKRLTPEVLARANRSAGRAVFEANCANCHRLFDAGGKIGPDLTGAQRFNLDYVLENIVDPSAAVSKDFQMHVLEMSSGRVVTGLIADESPVAVTVQTVNEKVVIPRDEIETRAISPLSIMPEGMLQKLTADQVRDLVGYLSSPAQVPK